jgi:hypothetical protein
MAPTPRRPDDRPSRYTFRFTPAEWRHLLEDRTFLTAPDNSWLPPRRLMGLPVQIVPDHRRASFETPVPGSSG